MSAQDEVERFSGQGPGGEDFADIAQRAFDLARTGDSDRLEAYLSAGLPVDLATGSGDSLLMLAAYHGHAATVAALAARGADVNALNDRGQSPLAGAVFKGSAAVVEQLLKLGADPDAGQPSARQTAAMFDRVGLHPDLG
ncbi:ankyrin repeat domain-containing protein [Natronoglycomyces albus]|uniref:Ankyrin repeat domain-containing protein n=1 Tax=Natronoglycomyces albus TaxID=2811108 RepID=A0A895XNW6_9ACTN|nr:ankyrin repeat domain-containing protein [Natronoglycomyces albus]QSB06827.1 ankyrin repeat domain-containing protein [Natronoglycomyces albus]